MVQMPVHPSRNWKTYTGKAGYESYKYAIIDFSGKDNSWDEDIAKCMIYMHLQLGSILRIKKEDGDIIVSMDGRQVKTDSNHNHNMIQAMIEPLISQLHEKVLATMSNSTELDAAWSSHLPGVTKIKIYMSRFSNNINYTMQHKMGRDGGKNYHTTGVLKLKEDESRETNNKV